MHDIIELVENLRDCPLKIKDRVMTKRLGLPCTGTLVSIIPSFLMAGNRPAFTVLWDETYPEWVDGYVCNIVFDQEQKPYSYEEFLKISNKDLSPNVLRELYEQTPNAINNIYPIEDLELME